MSLEPITSAPLAIQIHVVAALSALVLGLVQLLGAKGSMHHRRLGFAWAGLMLLVAVTGLFIHTIRLIGPFSPIHLLSLVILVTVPMGIVYARRGNVAAHRRSMQMIFWLALVIAGLFTLLPGRIMAAVLFGTQ